MLITETKPRLSSIREQLKLRSEAGFTLIDVVVTVAIIVALSVGGFIAYNGLVDSAKQGATGYAASNVYKAAAVYESDGLNETTACSAIDEYNDSGEGIKVELLILSETGTLEDAQRYSGAAASNTYNC